MGTKLNPGTYDCYAIAEPDEPMFVLLARDDRAPALVEAWADVSEKRGTNPAKVAEARQCAQAMREWRARNNQRNGNESSARSPVKVDMATLRMLAVKAEADPRTVAKVLRNENVRGVAGQRIRRVLIEAGLFKD